MSRNCTPRIGQVVVAAVLMSSQFAAACGGENGAPRETAPPSPRPTPSAPDTLISPTTQVTTITPPQQPTRVLPE